MRKLLPCRCAFKLSSLCTYAYVCGRTWLNASSAGTRAIACLSLDKSKTCNLIGLREFKTAESAHTRNRAIVTRPFSLAELECMHGVGGGVGSGTRLLYLEHCAWHRHFWGSAMRMRYIYMRQSTIKILKCGAYNYSRPRGVIGSNCSCGFF